MIRRKMGRSDSLIQFLLLIFLLKIMRNLAQTDTSMGLLENWSRRLSFTIKFWKSKSFPQKDNYLPSRILYILFVCLFLIVFDLKNRETKILYDKIVNKPIHSHIILRAPMVLNWHKGNFLEHLILDNHFDVKRN